MQSKCEPNKSKRELSRAAQLAGLKTTQYEAKHVRRLDTGFGVLSKIPKKDKYETLQCVSKAVGGKLVFP